MIINYLLQFIGSTLVKYLFGGIAIAILSSGVYFFVSTHFSNKVALKTAVSKQKKQSMMNKYSHQLSKEYEKYRRGITSKEISCRSDDCTVEELKRALT